MRNYRTVAIVLILVGLLSVSAQAQVIPGRWEKIEALGGRAADHSRLEKRGSARRKIRRTFPVRALPEKRLGSGGDSESGYPANHDSRAGPSDERHPDRSWNRRWDRRCYRPA